MSQVKTYYFELEHRYADVVVWSEEEMALELGISAEHLHELIQKGQGLVYSWMDHGAYEFNLGAVEDNRVRYPWIDKSIHKAALDYAGYFNAPGYLTVKDGEYGLVFRDEDEFIPFKDLGYNSKIGFFRKSDFPKEQSI